MIKQIRIIINKFPANPGTLRRFLLGLMVTGMVGALVGCASRPTAPPDLPPAPAPVVQRQTEMPPVDANNIVQSASGNAQLTDGLVTGDQYVVDMDTLPASPTFAELDAAYLAGTPQNLGGANPTIPVSALSIAGLDLSAPQHRNIIVAHTVSGTRAYQVFRITFNHP